VFCVDNSSVLIYDFLSLKYSYSPSNLTLGRANFLVISDGNINVLESTLEVTGSSLRQPNHILSLLHQIYIDKKF